MNAIEIKKLKFSYGQKLILDLPEFSVKAGEIVFLQGPSGSGKSTLLELISGVLQSQEGELSVQGIKLNELSTPNLDQYRSENIGYIFQSFNLVSYLTVEENILLPFLFSKKDIDQDLLKKLIQKLGLASLVNQNVTQLSVGQQQRVAVARALIKKPKVILADEPTSALDYNHREVFLKLLFDLSRELNITVLFVSHDLQMQSQFDRVADLQTLNKTSQSILGDHFYEK